MSLDLPPIGLGTAGLSDPAMCRRTIKQALDIGYRHIDTAQMYDNEAIIGKAIAESSVDREEIVLATKIHPENLAYADVKETARESLTRLGVETVDLLYVHWPIRAYNPSETLAAMSELQQAGVARNVGVSNFTPELLDEARQLLDVPIAAHQVECHPLLQQEELRADAQAHSYPLVAYAPLGRASISHPVLETIADKHNITVPLVCLAWGLATDGIVPIPKATGHHLEANWNIQSNPLDQQDIEQINEIKETERLIDPDDAAWNSTATSRSS